jgi:hypothetical protein
MTSDPIGWPGVRCGQGYRAAPDDPPVEVGTVVAVDVPLVAVHVIATCRIGWVVDEPDALATHVREVLA